MRHLESLPREDFISPNWNVTHSLIMTEFLPGFAFSWRKLLHPEIYQPLPRGSPRPVTDRKGVNRTFPLCGTSLKVHPSFISRSSNWSALLQLNCTSTAPLLNPGSLPPFQVLVPRSLPNNPPACQTSLYVSFLGMPPQTCRHLILPWYILLIPMTSTQPFPYNNNKSIPADSSYFQSNTMTRLTHLVPPCNIKCNPPQQCTAVCWNFASLIFTYICFLNNLPSVEMLSFH